MKKMNKKGFTIVELVIVIAVIAILAAVLIPTFSSIVDKANKSATLQEARNYYSAAYADDIEDGVIDGQDINDADVAADAGTYDHDGDTIFTYTARGWVASFDGTDWTVEAEE